MKTFQYSNELLDDEFENYIRLNKLRYELPVDVLLDETDAHTSYGHEVIIFFRNSYDVHSFNFVAMNVSNNPIILSDKLIEISDVDLMILKNWIVEHQTDIIELAKCVIKYDEFSNRVAKYHEL